MLIGVQMYNCIPMGSNGHFNVVCCTTDRKQFHIIIHSRPFAFMETVANGAVRLSVDLLHSCISRKRWCKRSQ